MVKYSTRHVRLEYKLPNEPGKSSYVSARELNPPGTDNNCAIWAAQACFQHMKIDHPHVDTDANDVRELMAEAISTAFEPLRSRILSGDKRALKEARTIYQIAVSALPDVAVLEEKYPGRPYASQPMERELEMMDGIIPEALKLIRGKKYLSMEVVVWFFELTSTVGDRFHFCSYKDIGEKTLRLVFPSIGSLLDKDVKLIHIRLVVDHFRAILPDLTEYEDLKNRLSRPVSIDLTVDSPEPRPKRAKLNQKHLEMLELLHHRHLLLCAALSSW
jgi:hypothetical protein